MRFGRRGATPGGIFFAVAMPVGLFAFTMPIGVGGAVEAGQVPFGVYLAAGMTARGAVVTGFVNLPEAPARARDRGVLKRLRGTPLRPGEYLAGRAVAALLVALGTGVLVVAVGIGAFGVRFAWAGRLPAAAVLTLGTATLAACGFALAAVLPSGKAVAAVGLAILLPGSFSDVFPTGGALAWMGTGSVLPLRHLSHSLRCPVSTPDQD